MDKRKKLTLSLAITSVVFLVLSIILRAIRVEKNVVAPFSNSPGIFSYFQSHNRPKSVVFGYLPWWMLEDLKYIQLDKLTDVAYFGFQIKKDGGLVKNLENGKLEPGYNNWVDNTDLKDFIKKAQKQGVRLSITVISHEDSISDSFLDCRNCWKTLVNNLKAEMNKHGIKNVNLNFEYGGETAPDKAKKYTELVEYVNVEMDKTYRDSFVTVATFADSAKTQRVSSDLSGLGKVADGIFIMGYDFHRPDSETAGPVAPIKGPGFDILEMLDSYLAVVPPKKIIMGVPYYGYNWVVTDPNPKAERIPGDDSIGYSQSQIYAYVKETVIENRPKILWDDEAKTPYFSYISPETGSVRQVYFENVDSLREKYRLIKEKDLGGVGIWALGYDKGYVELWDLLGEEFVW